MGELVDYHAILSKATQEAMQAGKQAFEKTIDVAAEKTYEKIKITIPYKEGNLKGSFEKIAEIKGSKKRSHRYGWYLKFDGYNINGIAYQLIANTINKGFPATKKRGTISGTFFIDNAVAGLKGLDLKIIENIQISMNDYMGKELT